MSSDKNVFFGKHDVLKRILCLYGHCEDSFFVSGTMQNSMEYMLESHLRKIGYDLVLFYNGVQRLYCFSQEMANRRDEIFEENRGLENERTQAIDDEIGSFLGTESTETVPLTSEASLRIHMDDEQIASFADQLMRREDIRVALVFSDGWDLLENTAPATLRTLTHHFRSWYHLSASNQNIVILCFSSLTQAHLSECVNHVPGWSFLRDKIIQGNAFTSAVKYLSIPGKDEIEGRLRFEKQYREFSLIERERIISSVQCRLHDMGNTLKGLDDFLINTDNPFQVLLEADVSDEKAWDILQNTRGWEAVAKAVKRIAKNVKMSVSDRHLDEQVTPDIISRMRETAPFKASGICCNIVLKGNPGTGKTTIAKLLGKIFRQLKLLPSGHVVEVARDDLVGRYIGHTAANTRAKIEEAMGGILFIDEAYSLFRDNDGRGTRDFGVEAIDTLIEAMTRSVGSFAVVLAGYPEEMEHMLDANPGFRSRFGHNIITIEDYQPDLLRDISINHLAEKYGHLGLSFAPKLMLPGVTGKKPLDVFFEGWFAARNRKHFGNARDCINLVEFLAEHAQNRGSKNIEEQDFPDNLVPFFKEADLDINTVLVSLEDIIGQEAVKKKLISIVHRLKLRNQQLQSGRDSKLDKIAPGHYLFSGNPGTGKSTIAVKFAQVLGALRITGRFTPTRVTGNTLLAAWEKGGIAGMKKIIEDARGGVLFIDEAHQLINRPRALQLLLDPMINMRQELCVILACYEKDIEPLFNAEPGLRSRLNDIFHFADYTVDELFAIFEKKIATSGYCLGEGTQDEVKRWLNNKLNEDSESSNGRYAEKLIMDIEEKMASRLNTLELEKNDDRLFTIQKEDIPESTLITSVR